MARRIQEDKDQSSASARRRTSSSRSGGKRTGTIADRRCCRTLRRSLRLLVARLGVVLNMGTVSERDLRDHAAEVLDTVAHGEFMTVTRDGVAVAELRPLPRRGLSAAQIIERRRHLAPIDPEWMRRDFDGLFDLAIEHARPRPCSTTSPVILWLHSTQQPCAGQRRECSAPASAGAPGGHDIHQRSVNYENGGPRTDRQPAIGRPTRKQRRACA